MAAPETNTTYNRASGEQEHILDLPDGRQLAYAHNGPPTSRTIVIHFSGMMSIGTAPDVPPSLRALHVHWIAPTLPGVGRSSTRDSSVPYHIGLARDMTTLLTHFYPTDEYDAIFLVGGSYGTVPAQMLYGCPYIDFPAGRKIAGCLLLSGFSPAKYDTNHAKSFSWYNWFSLGPPSQLPFRPVQRVLKHHMTTSMFTTLESGKTILRKALADQSEQERIQLAKSLQSINRTEDEYLETLARNAMRSQANWDGFMEMADVIREDWNFEPIALDEEHASKPMLVIASQSDHISESNYDWIVKNYKSAKGMIFRGGSSTVMRVTDNIWQELLQMAGYKD